ncbi:MAG: hypothetical protein EOO29_56645, partial [Comamonadaceae bacterium]
TLGRAALEAQRDREPVVVIDGTGITDLRNEVPEAVPWGAMERVRLDSDDRIVVRLLQPEKASALRVASLALQRWQRGGDVVVSLAGLAHNPHALQRALGAFHQAATAPIQAQARR